MEVVIKEGTLIECTVKLPKSYSGGRQSSKIFMLQNRKCNLELGTDVSQYDPEVYLAFKSDGYFNPAVDVIVSVTSPDATNVFLPAEKHRIAEEYQVIWSHTFRFLQGCALTFTIHADLSKESQHGDVAACYVPDENQKSSISSKNIHLEALDRDFSKMLIESSSFDVEIACEGKTFKAHRIVLEARSTVFSAMLKSDMVEGKTGLIKLEDITASIFESFLRYLYSGTFPELSVDTAKQFYEASDKYAVEELKIACSEFLTKNLSVRNACEVLVLADQHSDENFRKNVISYIVEKKIPRRDKKWSDFCKKHPILAIDVQNVYIQKHCPE